MTQELNTVPGNHHCWFSLHAHTQAMLDEQPGRLSAGGVDCDLLARFTRLAPLVGLWDVTLDFRVQLTRLFRC